MGIAFDLQDPDNLLGKSGITVALVKRDHKGLIQETHHNPMNAGFPNGTLKGNIKIRLDDVIGGPKNVGHGWKMLMECLAAGRGVSLPASSLGACLATSYGITGYAKLRKQFNIPISRMEGVYEKLYEVMYNTLLIDFGIRMKTQMRNIYFFITNLFLLFQFNSAFAQGGISWRRPLLPGGSLLEYNDSQSGQFSLGISYEHEQLNRAKYGDRFIPNYNKERTNNSSLTIISSYGITDHFTISAFFPFRYILNQKVLFRGQNPNLYNGGKYFRESYGLGDVLLQARIQRTFFNEIPIVLGIGVKLSNGKINMTDEFGERISDNLQVGTGTVDPILSIYSSQDIKRLVLSGGIFTRISTGENIYGYKYGNEIQTLINLDYIENHLLYGGLQVSHLLSTRDYYEYGKISRDRGGESYFLTGKIGTKATDNLDFEMTLQIPLHQNLNESQLVSPFIIQFGSLYRFGI